ncbi:MAG: 50S ribosomal protein L5 [Ilumatobacteraceae bacterium]
MMATATAYIPRLKAHYNNVVRVDLAKEIGAKNVMQVPTLEKIVINMGVGRATQQSSLIDGAVADLTAISGQKPQVTKSRTAIASFKLRENQPIGAKVTMRGDRMWEFLDRLLAVAIPRIRDFRGFPGKSWDGHGNYTFGLTEQLVFLEINYDKVDTTRGMDITIVTTAKTDVEGKALLDAFGFPFRKGEAPASAKKSRSGATKRTAKSKK